MKSRDLNPQTRALKSRARRDAARQGNLDADKKSQTMNFSSINPILVIRILTIAALGGLLLAVGLRLTWAEVAEALRRCRMGWVLVVNFVVVPALTLLLAWMFQVGRDLTIGMLLLAAAPFAPVVPVFARMARADLALAAGLTGLFPFLSALLTPVVCLATRISSASGR